MKKIIVLIVIMSGIVLAENPSNTTVQTWLNNYTGFEENLGQIADIENNPVPSVLFKINLPDYNIFITENGVSFVLYHQKEEQINYARFDIVPVNGTMDKSKIELSDEIPGYNNYYLSHCPDGILSVKSYRYIKIKDLYPGINWVWRYDDKVHSEFEVKPNGDISNIKLKVKWADIDIKNGKELVYSTPLGKINEGKLYVYEKQESDIAVATRCVSASYQLDEQGLIAFDIQGYDKSKTLIIDPPFERLWATYYGGTGQDNCDGSRTMGAMTSDNLGNIFVTGFTGSTNFPTIHPGGNTYFQGSNAGQIDIFIIKFSNSGVRQWATYYGGTADEIGIALTTDIFGNLFVTGNTFSAGFPIYNPGGGAFYQGTIGGSGDVYILKFNNEGKREWATFYGGYSSDVGYAITTDNSGNIFITGNTFSSTNFPTYNPGGGAYFQSTNAGSFDAFILKFSNTGVRQWATYYGGTDDDNGYGITADSSGNIFITGMTRSTNFPILDAGGGAYYQTSILGYRTVFILKFTNAGVRQWATYYGGSTNDYGYSIATDISGKVFVTGSTSSTNFPTYDAGGGAYYQGTNVGSDDVFILKFTNTGIREWATYYGGTSGDFGRSITIDNGGNIFITGNTVSSNFSTYLADSGAYYQPTLAGGHEAFILGFNNSGVRRWATYYGGTSTDYGMSIIADNSNNIYLTGFSLSSNFPTYNPGGSTYFQGSNAGSYDAYILKFASASTGIEEEIENCKLKIENFSVFPNPASSFFNIKYVGATSQSRLSNLGNLSHNILKIFDVSGKLVKEEKFQSSKVISLDGIRNGVYFIKVGNELVKEKLVVTK